MGKILLFAFLLSLVIDPVARSSEASHRADWEAWRAKRLESLRREDGWLTLVGLFWLEEGENTFGSDPSNRIVFPSGKAPTRMGSILLRGGVVSVSVDPRVEVTREGKFITQMRLQTDAGGAQPTVLKHGSLSFYVIERGKRMAVRVKDSQAQARRNFHGIETFPYQERLRIQARFEPYDPPRMIPVPNVLGTRDEEKSPGALVFEWDGKTYRLEPVLEEGETDLFVIFGDATNGSTTYGGGRFLYAKPPDTQGRTVLDFNRSYNPPCVFTPYATCPLPPKQNRLPISIEAGEKNYEH
jgi:uncharacterized protein